jgi:aryl-alcohol dehydrogenase-like predicted oxidoreductase
MKRFSVDNRRRVQSMLQQIQPVADEHGISLTQLAIAWTAAQPGCSHVLCGARNRQQVSENAGAGDVNLSDEQIQRINNAIAEYEAAVV